MPRIRRANLRTPSAPRLGRFRLAPPRSPESLRLDSEAPRDRYNRAGGEDGELEPVPYVDWATFLSIIGETWGKPGISPKGGQGEHVTLVGATGSGKTTLALQLLGYRSYVCVLGTKNEDAGLYPELQGKGYVLTGKPELNYREQPRVIFRPKLADLSAESKAAQAEDFKAVLDQVFDEGRWCLYGDEIRYLSDNLGLSKELDSLWLQGRSMGISMVVSTQRPVSIPVIAFESATHLFLFRATDRANIQRSSEFGGADVDLIRYTLPRLPRYEVLYVDTRTGEMLRTKVRL